MDEKKIEQKSFLIQLPINVYEAYKHECDKRYGRQRCLQLPIKKFIHNFLDEGKVKFKESGIK